MLQKQTNNKVTTTRKRELTTMMNKTSTHRQHQQKLSLVIQKSDSWRIF
jgi:hypothetical protein